LSLIHFGVPAREFDGGHEIPPDVARSVEQ